METNNITPNNNGRNNSRMTVGIIIAAFGFMLLFRRMGLFFVPHFIFTWPMWLIVIGLAIGARSNFSKPNWVWMVGLGVVFLTIHAIPFSAAFMWPAFIIAIGVWMMTRYNHNTPKPGANNGYTDFTEVK